MVTEEKGFLVLIVDDNPQNLQVLAALIEECGGDSILAMNGKEALQALSVDSPELILMDVMMPEMDGYEVCRILKTDPKHKRASMIPVIFITAKTDSEDIVKGFKAGGVDYISKPFIAEELKMRIFTHLKLYHTQRELMRLNEDYLETNKKLSQAMEQLRVASVTDTLTGIYNRRHVMLRMEDEATQIKRYGGSFSIILADIDFFKCVNDTYGHDCGDHVLKETARILKEKARVQDVLARWGGEEFLIFLPKTNLEGAMILADRMRKAIEQEKIRFGKATLQITITMGVAEYDREEPLDRVIKRSDVALYEGKEAGRNRVVAGT